MSRLPVKLRRTKKQARYKRSKVRVNCGTTPEKLHGAMVSTPANTVKHEKAAKVERAANSFEVVAREWYVKFAPGWAEHHGDRIIRRFERDIFPWIGGGRLPT
jgi:hypothetical protein